MALIESRRNMATIIRGTGIGIKVNVISAQGDYVWGEIMGDKRKYKISALKFDPAEFKKVMKE